MIPESLIQEYLTGFSSSNWTEFGEWSQCSSSCGLGHKSKTRECKDMFCGRVGNNYCVGDHVEVEPCETKPNSASWSAFGSWSQCSSSCGPGQRSRALECKDVACGRVDNNYCDGDPVEVEPCVTEPNSASWVAFGNWSQCSTSCGPGHRSRTLECEDQTCGRVDNIFCSGDPVEVEPCAAIACQGRFEYGLGHNSLSEVLYPVDN